MRIYVSKRRKTEYLRQALMVELFRRHTTAESFVDYALKFDRSTKRAEAVADFLINYINNPDHSLRRRETALSSLGIIGNKVSKEYASSYVFPAMIGSLVYGDAPIESEAANSLLRMGGRIGPRRMRMLVVPALKKVKSNSNHAYGSVKRDMQWALNSICEP